HLPAEFDPSEIVPDETVPLVLWLTHHDVRFPGYEEVGRFVPREIPGVVIVINGHIHRPLADVVAGTTTWVNPGNIARVRRSDADRSRRPSVLRINIRAAGWGKPAGEVPCLPDGEDCHEVAMSTAIRVGEAVCVP